jgi:hypothetical protein
MKQKLLVLMVIILWFCLDHSLAKGKFTIKRMASFEPWKGTVSAGNNGIVRVFEDLGLKYWDDKDSVQFKQGNPKWEGEWSRFDDYRWNGKEFLKESMGFTNFPESLFLAGDTIDHGPSGFNFEEVDLKISTGLPDTLTRNLARIKHFKQADIDCDGEKENIIVFTEWTDSSRHEYRSPIRLIIYNSKEKKAVIRCSDYFEDGSWTGPLEIRDVTDDGCPEVIFRVVYASGGFTYQERIYGRVLEEKKKE